MSKTIHNFATSLWTYGNTSNAIEAECTIAKAQPEMPSVLPVKTADRTKSAVGDTITYTYTMTIGDGVDLFSPFVFRDSPDETTSFVAGSVKVNGIPKPDADIIEGFTYEAHPNDVVVITYEVHHDTY